MKKLIFSIAVVGLVFTACKKDLQDVKADSDLNLNAGTQAIVDTVTLPQIISANRTLTADTLYLLNGKVYVTGGTLNILPGTQVQGVYKSSPDSASALVVTKTGKIIAKGNQSTPVVFTSFLGGLPGGRTNRLPGDWGGIVLLGNAPTNKPSTQFIEGINPATVPAGVDVTYGGSNATHSAGTIFYVRIEFAGAAIAPNNELNSLTFGGVGSQTTLRYVQASYGADDAFEFFGGTVTGKYLIANSQNDDGFDFDFGYTGNIQFGISVRNPAYVYNDGNGTEVDNENPSSGATPTTRPLLSNLTIIGNANAALTGSLNGGRFRRGTDLRFRNSVLAGYATGIAFENTLASNTPAFFRNNAVHAFTDSAKFVSAPTVGPWGIKNLAVVGGAIPASWFNNVQPAVWSTLKSSALVYKTGGPLDPANASGVKPDYSGFSSNFLAVPYVGALGAGSPIKDANGNITIPNNWVAGSGGVWTNFDPS